MWNKLVYKLNIFTGKLHLKRQDEFIFTLHSKENIRSIIKDIENKTEYFCIYRKFLLFICLLSFLNIAFLSLTIILYILIDHYKAGLIMTIFEIIFCCGSICFLKIKKSHSLQSFKEHLAQQLVEKNDILIKKGLYMRQIKNIRLKFIIYELPEDMKTYMFLAKFSQENQPISILNSIPLKGESKLNLNYNSNINLRITEVCDSCNEENKEQMQVNTYSNKNAINDVSINNNNRINTNSSMGKVYNQHFDIKNNNFI